MGRLIRRAGVTTDAKTALETVEFYLDSIAEKTKKAKDMLPTIMPHVDGTGADVIGRKYIDALEKEITTELMGSMEMLKTSIADLVSRAQQGDGSDIRTYRK